MAEKSINCFKNFVAVAKMDNENEEQETIDPTVTGIMDLFTVNGCKFSDVFFKFFEKFYDENSKDIEFYQVDFFEMIVNKFEDAKIYNYVGMTDGLSRFI